MATDTLTVLSSDNCGPISEHDLSSELLSSVQWPAFCGSAQSPCAMILPSWWSWPYQEVRGQVRIRRTGPCHYSAHNPNTVLGICDSLDQWLATEMRQETPSANIKHLALATNFIRIRIRHLMWCLEPVFLSPLGAQEDDLINVENDGA